MLGLGSAHGSFDIIISGKGAILKRTMAGFEAKSVCVLGRQPALGLAELESLYGAERIRPVKFFVDFSGDRPTGGAAMLDIDAGKIDFKRLGGTVKVARLLAILPTVSWHRLL